MRLVNTTPLATGYALSTDKIGREWLVVVAKGTFAIPESPGLAPRLAAEQLPLVAVDTYAGDPATSAPLYESDFGPVRPRCDVVLHGTCHAPGSRAAERVRVGMRVGAAVKAFDVVGDRTWQVELGLVVASPPLPFVRMPVSYDRAFGGVDRTAEDPQRHVVYPENPVGRGFCVHDIGAVLAGRALPNTQEIGVEVTTPRGKYRPMALGALGRGWRQRIRWAGTYDADWLAGRFPFLPDDFDPRFHQCAPEDQQIPYPRGGEEVVLTHLDPRGTIAFHLPGELALPVVFVDRDGNVAELPAVVDTVLLEPDAGRFLLCWRAALPLRRNVREVREVTVGWTAAQLERDQERARRQAGKQHFPSLAELVAWSRTRRDQHASSPR